MTRLPLENYLNLIRQLDSLCDRISSNLAERIACRAGCAGCCRHITLFPVEAVALSEAQRHLPPEQASPIRERARTATPDSPCPLLHQDICLLYEARPVICRTHGMPLLLTGSDGIRRVDFCPRNFQGAKSLPGDAVIDLDRLNETLAAVNALFTKEWEGKGMPLKERFTIAEALLLEKCY